MKRQTKQNKRARKAKQAIQQALSKQPQQPQAVAKSEKKRKKRVMDKTKFRLSWLTKIGNDDFSSTTNEILESMEMWIKGKSIIPDAPFDRARKYLDQMISMAPKQMGHELTASIQELHADRKRQITTIRTYVKLLLQPHMAKDNEQRTQYAEMLKDWFQRILGTRHYDLGIGTLRSRLSYILSEIENSQDLQDALKLCGVDDLVEELRKNHDTLETAHTRRDVETSALAMEPSFDELRAKIYKEICLLVRWVGDLIDMEEDNRIYIEMRNIFYHYLTPKRANYIQQRTKRRLRREAALAKREKELQRDRERGELQFDPTSQHTSSDYHLDIDRQEFEYACAFI